MFSFFKVGVASIPDEGLWLPLFIQGYNYEEMKKMGLQLSAEDLYHINHSSIKDAIVQFGNGTCSGSIISEDGLLLTNLHCGVSFIADHSDVEHNYLKNGYWAMRKSEELPNEGLTINILKRMEDVTSLIIDSIPVGLTASEREAIIEERTIQLVNQYSDNEDYTITLKSFFEGKQYILSVYTTYKDIRLVAAPPSCIGTFGGETDNWTWPRHSGDFCLFRIYTAPDGTPATYSPSNIAYQPDYFLPISLDGYKKGDFTMICGYPNLTNRYLTSYELNNMVNILNPALLEACDAILPVLKDAMQNNNQLRIGYANHYAGFANNWKNKKGETLSLQNLKVVEKRREQEILFMKWVAQDSMRKVKYGSLLSDIQSICSDLDPIAIKKFWYANISLLTSKTLILPFRLQGVKPEHYHEKSFSQDKIDILMNNYEKLMAGTDAKTECKIIFASLNLLKKLPDANRPDIFLYIEKEYKGDLQLFANAIIEKSIFGNAQNFSAFLQKPSLKVYENDPLIRYFFTLFELISKNQNLYYNYFKEMDAYRALIVEALNELGNGTPIYPDANQTLRYSYGQVMDYSPKNGVHLDYFTTAEGLLEKESASNYDFLLPDTIKTLILNKKFDNFGVDGQLPVCFITNNDIAGGSSGSPVLNAEGELIGCTFDSNWEALSCDFAYNYQLQRAINVDIRYVLWIIKNIGHADYLFNEMILFQIPNYDSRMMD